LVSRWGGRGELLVEGFVAVPTAFLKYLGSLKPGLTPAEALFVLELMVYKWDAQAPFPGYKTLADRMGVSEVYARKLGRSLHAKGHLRRQPRVGQTNLFDLQPLFDRLAAHATAEKDKRDSVRRPEVPPWAR
jgi:hypothetical protein